MSITLYLENFRCWKKKTFTFNKNGIILLSGISGKGKSTILNAIVFAVTGNMKNVTPMGREKEHLKVELSIDDVVISRCKNPTRFTVKKLNNETGKIKVYEEDEAQSIIDDLLGTDFKHCSYIDQDNTFSFVYLSPEAKMTFLRNLLLSNEPVNEYRDNIKTLLDKTKTEILKEDATINISSGFLKKMTFIQNNVEFYSTKESTKKEKAITLDTFTKVMESLQRNLEISQKNHKILSTKKSKAESDYKRSIENQSNRQKRTELKEELHQICGDLTVEMMQEKLTELKRQQDRYKKYKQYKKEKDEYISIKTKVDELTFQLESLSMHQENVGDIKIVQKVVSMEEKLIEMQDKITEEQEQILEKMVNELKKEKNDIEKKIEQVHLYNCPSCNEYLNMVNGVLVLYKEKVEKEKGDNISSLTYALSLVEKNLKNVQKQLDVLLHQRSEYNKLFDQFELLTETIQKKYNTNDYSALLSTLKKDEQTFLFTKKTKEDTERQLIRFNLDNEDNEVNEEELVTEDVTEDTVREILKIQHQLSRHVDISLRLKKLSESESENDVSDNVDYSALLSEYKEKILQTDEKISQYSDSIRRLEIWRQNEENNIKYKELEESIQRSKDAKEYGMKVVKCCEKLLLYVKDAETRSIFDFIESLNYHASLYIEDFFPDEDFHVQLSTTKELKSGKDKMGLFFEVQYGTMKGELDFLSGGQRDRVNLAFTLAFSELVQNRVLLLDECISSLDSATSDTVIETLHQKYKGKLIICVAHQVNTGVFDQVVEI
jgi:DNA repair exonuclease SbcCD ATPase subunit